MMSRLLCHAIDDIAYRLELFAEQGWYPWQSLRGLVFLLKDNIFDAKICDCCKIVVRMYDSLDVCSALVSIQVVDHYDKYIQLEFMLEQRAI